MKKLYMPTKNELASLQNENANIYKYLMVKAIESLAIQGTKYPSKGMLKSTYKYIQENPYISFAICRMYPKEIEYSQYAQNDINLCLELLEQPQEKNMIYSLDNLSYFEKGAGVFSNDYVISSTVKSLGCLLCSRPQYRFEYQDNTLLDKIFNRELIVYREEIKLLLAEIEPAYLLLPEYQNQFSIGMFNKLINYYAERYGITDTTLGKEYIGKDIINKPDENVKKLIKCINQSNK